MDKTVKPFLIIEITKGEKGGNKFLCTFLGDDSEAASEEFDEESGVSQEETRLKAFNAAKEPYCILPAVLVSFKIFDFPFRLKNGRQILSLIIPALEEQSPVSAEDLYVAFTKLNDNSVLAEYIRKDKLGKIRAGLAGLTGRTDIRFFSPYSLLYKISAELNSAERKENSAFTLEGNGGANGGSAYPSASVSVSGTFDSAVVYRSGAYYLGLLFENGNLKDIVNFNLPFNSGLLETPAYLNAKVIYIEKELRTYMYGNGAIKRKNLPGSFAAAGSSAKKGFAGYFLLNAEKVFIFSLIFLILTVMGAVWQAQSLGMKSGEKAVLQNKINSILSAYMPGQKIFYEPRTEIKQYYDSVKKNSLSENAGIHFLNLLNYASAFKPAVKGFGIDKMDYSAGRFSLTGTVPDYKSLNKLEKYLKEKYSGVTAANPVKTEAGVSFTVYLKK